MRSPGGLERNDRRRLSLKPFVKDSAGLCHAPLKHMHGHDENSVAHNDVHLPVSDLIFGNLIGECRHPSSDHRPSPLDTSELVENAAGIMDAGLTKVGAL